MHLINVVLYTDQALVTQRGILTLTGDERQERDFRATSKFTKRVA